MFLSGYAAVPLKSVAVGQVMLYQDFSPYAGGGHAVELPFCAVTEINALK